MFAEYKPAALRAKCLEQSIADDASVTAFLAWAATFFSNMGNYLSFGDRKIVPDLPKATFVAILDLANASMAASVPSVSGVVDLLYDTSPALLNLGFAPQGISTYYGAGVTKEDAEVAQRFMDSKGLSAYNTRLFKSTSDAGQEERLVIWQASARSDGEGDRPAWHAGEAFEGRSIEVRGGDHGPIMARIAANLQAGVGEVANDHERAMLTAYVDSFTSGSIDAHKDGSRSWIKNKGPVVETYIGFIESYVLVCRGVVHDDGCAASRQPWDETGQNTHEHIALTLAAHLCTVTLTLKYETPVHCDT